MASQETIARAITTTKRNMSDIGTPHSRIHNEAPETWAAILRALEHPCCAGCNHLIIQFPRHSDREIAALRCDVGHSPVGLWKDLWLADTATCPDCTDPAGKPKEATKEEWMRS